MTSDERISAAETVLDAIDFTDNDQNYVCLNALIAIARLLQNIDNRQQQQAGS